MHDYNAESFGGNNTYSVLIPVARKSIAVMAMLLNPIGLQPAPSKAPLKPRPPGQSEQTEQQTYGRPGIRHRATSG